MGASSERVCVSVALLWLQVSAAALKRNCFSFSQREQSAGKPGPGRDPDRGTPEPLGAPAPLPSHCPWCPGPGDQL